MAPGVNLCGVRSWSRIKAATVCLVVKRRAPSLKGRLLHARVYYGQPLARVEREVNQQAVGEREVVAALDGWKVGRLLGRARVAAVTE